jgi:AAA+ superfamily predicted ATPase
LIFVNAHELNNPHKKQNHSGSQVIQTLEDVLGEENRRWMLLLTGEAAGIEALLSTHPRLSAYIPRIVYMQDCAGEKLMGEVEEFCQEYDLQLTEDAETRLKALLMHTNDAPSHHVRNLFSDKILPAMSRRLTERGYINDELLRTIEAEDIPSFSYQESEALQELDALVGLGEIKTRLHNFLEVVKLADRRRCLGLVTQMPRLQMVFLGNPGTGKTTVARIVGRVLASWGILSRGQVICTEKSELVGEYVGETEVMMRDLIARATGNVLFIDEAYQLVEGYQNDHGRIVLNSLLTLLGSDNLDMVVILAGYTAPMKRLLESNEGIESRFPNVFNFEDYTPDELLEIGRQMVGKQGFVMTEGAEKNLRAIIEEESKTPSSRFGNGRFVSNLIQNEILSSLGKRTGKLANPTREELSTILPEDVIIGKSRKEVVFDNVAIDASLARLDSLAGLDTVKQAIHNFVDSTRYLHSIGESYVGKGLLSWRFIGNDGTGKSTVAEILAAILKGMHLIANSQITEVKGERIIDVPEPECEAVLRDAVKKSCNGLIFIDIDDPYLFDFGHRYHRIVEQIRLRLKELTIESGGECALVLADISAPNLPVAEELAEGGVPEFDHTLVFKDFTAEELYEILCSCLKKFDVTFSTAAEKHMRAYLESLHKGTAANARTMKLMSRTIYQQIVLRESCLSRRPKAHQVQLSDIETFRWNSKKGKIGY